MIIHPAIAALRADPGSQRRRQLAMQQAAQQWRSDDSVQKLQREIGAYEAGFALEDCPTLRRLLYDSASARDFTARWCSQTLAHVSQMPLAEVPFSHRQSGGYSTVRLLTYGSATLSLSAYERRVEPVQAQAALFVDREMVELVLRGKGRGTFHKLGEGNKISTEARVWETGDLITTRANEARQFADVSGSMLVLQLTRSPENPAPTREIRLCDGALVKRASGNKASSRDMLALGVLGALGHAPAVDVMEQTASDRSRETDLRWEAVRQLLALETLRGFSLLSSLAQIADDPIATPSAKLRNQLVKAYPQLAEKEAA